MTAAVIDFSAAKARIYHRKGRSIDTRTPEERREAWLKEWRIDQLCKKLEEMWPEDGPAAC